MEDYKTWYKAQVWGIKPEPVIAKRVSEKYIQQEGHKHRDAISTIDTRYFDDKDAAIDYLLQLREEKIKFHQLKLDRLNDEINEIKTENGRS